LPVIIVSGQPKDQYAGCCFREGAAAYIAKESATEELVSAAKKILDAVCELAPCAAERQMSPLDGAAGKTDRLQ